MKKILILEDDAMLANTLLVGLESAKAKTVWVKNLEHFYDYIENEHVDLCVMDRLIEGQDSIEAVGYIRDVLPQAKVLFLTKKTAVIDRIRGLEAGADDYLAKPFSLAELRLRARLLLALNRWHDGTKGIAMGELMFFPEQGTLETPEKKIFLRKREAEILMCLSKAAGNLVTKENIIKALWPAAYEPNPSTIDVYVRRLRQKMGKFQSILQTRRGYGYRLAILQGELQSDGGAAI